MIIDSSIAIKWLVKEEGWEKAEQLLFALDLAAPAIIDLEIATYLSRKVRDRSLSNVSARSLWRSFIEVQMHRSILDYADAAFQLSIHLWSGLPDCVFLACAIDRRDVLITTDGRFARAVRSRPEFARTLVLLDEL